MEAKELMKYDWVMNDRIGVCQVIGLPREVKDYPIEITVMYPAEGITEIRSIGEHYIQPVELTQEILENNGYKDNGALMYIQYLMEKDGRCRVSIIEASGGYQVMVNSILCSPKAIHYVHELQHALRLCGIEKEIVL